jgi:hypothetical protein
MRRLRLFPVNENYLGHDVVVRYFRLPTQNVPRLLPMTMRPIQLTSPPLGVDQVAAARILRMYDVGRRQAIDQDWQIAAKLPCN